jgi:anti-repressor protein
MDLIKLTTADIGENTVETVNARDLYEFLGVKTAFKDWIGRRIEEYDFQDEKDFCSFLSESSGGRPSKDYFLSLDMAKELSMVERNAKGKQARQYFIECERRARQPAELNDPGWLRSTLLTYTEKVLALEAQVNELLPSQDALDRISGTDGTMCVTDTAKALQMRPKDLFSFMRQNGWLYRRPGTSYDLGYQSKVIQGLLVHKVTTVLRPDGSEKVTEQVRVTGKGLTKLAKLIKPGIHEAA